VKYEGKWAQRILNLQRPDGSWGDFHTLSGSRTGCMTTEQALRRLEILGYSIMDEPMARAVSYLEECLAHRRSIPDRPEKVQDWNVFTSLILSTWIRRFTHECAEAERIAQCWAEIITAGFANGILDLAASHAAYQHLFGCKPQGGRLSDFVCFYQISLVSDLLDAKIASTFAEHVLHRPDGVYYVYDKPLAVVPQCFASLQTVRYLNAIELLAPYAPSKLRFVREWLLEHQDEDGRWDLGAHAKDGISFPLSDDWRRSETRRMDCTQRVVRLLNKLD